MEEIQRKLHEAAAEGNENSLQRLLEEDALAIERYTAGCFAETPLHIATMLGHLEFTVAILNQKPELAKELDFRRWSPLHLASANGHLQVVKALLLVNPDMCFAQDGDGWSPLHVAVIKGRVEVLKELVRAKPEAVLVKGERGQTILHVCVKHFQLEALKFLVEAVNDYEFVNSKDNEGFTVLHLAVAERDVEIINFLITKTRIEVNVLNANGFTALDIALGQGRRNVKDRDIQDSLRQVGAVCLKDTISRVRKLEAAKARNSSSTVALHMRPLRNSRVKKSKKHHKGKNNSWLEKMRDALMIVASLIATMAFQAGINPPGGTWQDDQQHKTPGLLHEVGGSIMADKNPGLYTCFMIYNTISLLSSLSVILILISGLPFRQKLSVWLLMIIMWIAVASTMLAYVTSLYNLSVRQGRAASKTVIGLYLVIGMLLAGHFFRLRPKLMKFARKVVKRDGSCPLSAISED